jgi:hypothetical protein
VKWVKEFHFCLEPIVQVAAEDPSVVPEYVEGAAGNKITEIGYKLDKLSGFVFLSVRFRFGYNR